MSRAEGKIHRMLKKAVSKAAADGSTGATVLVVKPAEHWLATAFAV
jgi:hypothetical protein